MRFHTTPSSGLIRPAALALVLGLAASAASAQVVMSARDSQVNASWLAGYANQSFAGGGSDADGNLFAVDGISLQGTDNASGFYPPTGLGWTAAFIWDIAHSYAVTGSGASALNSAVKIAASGNSNTTSTATGPATAGVTSALPGNLLSLSFFNPGQQTFLFRGGFSRQGPVNRNYVDIRIVDNLGMPVNVHGAEPGGSFNQLVTLPAGFFSIKANAVSQAGQNEVAFAAWDYSFEAVAVPEPGTWALWLAGVATLGLRVRTRARRTRCLTAQR
jgi:PEP-CTERM motif